jgi:hypothetical protein
VIDVLDGEVELVFMALEKNPFDISRIAETR